MQVKVVTPAKLQSCGHQSSRLKLVLGAVHQKGQISHYIGSTESPRLVQIHFLIYYWIGSDLSKHSVLEG
jgi:hypothetical protein